jgi:Sodium:solute symporter family
LLVSVATAYLVQHSASIMDYAMQLFSFFIAPLFGTVILGMLWKRATNQGGFWGLLAGTVTSIGLWVWVWVVEPIGLTVCRALSGRKRDGREFVPRVVGLAGMRGRYRTGEPGCETAERAPTGRIGHGRHYVARKGQMPLVPRTNILGWRCRCSLCGSEYCTLVGNPSRVKPVIPSLMTGAPRGWTRDVAAGVQRL